MPEKSRHIVEIAMSFMSFIETEKKHKPPKKHVEKGQGKTTAIKLRKTVTTRNHQRRNANAGLTSVRDKGIINESGENTGKRTTTAQNPNKQPSYRHNDGKTKLEK